MLKGIAELAKACEPATSEGSPQPALLNLSDEQIDKIAARMIEKLQTKQPEPEEKMIPTIAPVTEAPTDTTAGTAPAKPQPGNQKPVSISKPLVIALALADREEQAEETAENEQAVENAEVSAETVEE